MSTFAQSEGFEFVETIDKPTYSGILFGIGRLQPIYGLIKGVWKGKTFEFFNINRKYTEDGESNQYLASGVIVIQLGRTLPNVLIDSRIVDARVQRISFKGELGNSQKIQLEGDFNKYFDLYVPKDHEADVLYFLTPELMQLLMQYAKDYSFEVVNNQLFIYKLTSFDFTNNSIFSVILDLIDVIGHGLLDNIKYYSGSDALSNLENKNDLMLVKKQSIFRRHGSLIARLVGLTSGIIIVITMYYLAYR